MDLGIGGKAFCVVGGSRGIGWETARLLMAEGADVAVVSRHADTVAATVAEQASRYGVRAVALAADILQPGMAAKAIRDAHMAFGRLDGLAVTTHGEAHSPRGAELDGMEWQRQFAEVLSGPVSCVAAILPMLAEQGDGRIVLTGAYSARAPGPTILGYAAMKAALINLVKALAKVHGSDGIRLNAVCPGFIATERAEARLNAVMSHQSCERGEAEWMLLERAGLKCGLSRLGTAHEVADMIVFLLSDRAAYTSGLIANIDGGTDF